MKKPRPISIKDTLLEIIDHVNKMSPTDFKESLCRAGIIDKDGKLTEKYRENRE